MYSAIPDDTDILLPHGPPLGVLDGRWNGWRSILLCRYETGEQFCVEETLFEALKYVTGHRIRAASLGSTLQSLH